MKIRILLISLLFTASVFGQKYIADHTVAKDDVLRQIPKKYIFLAKKNLKIAYQHTSHGTHVSYGIYGLMDFKPGDDTLFAVSNSTANKALEFHDYAIASYSDGSNASDLSVDETAFIQATRNFLDDPANADINVIMWSWCNISGHNVAVNYIPGMDSLLNEYGIGGSKIGSAVGQREKSVSFIFMTGHGNVGDNIGDGKPKNQADLIISNCNTKQQFCLDYFNIDAHDMNDNYWEDAGDNGQSISYGGNFYADFEKAGTLGVDFYENKSSVDGTVAYGQHNDQHVTANRKSFAMWWILARIAGWDGLPDEEQDTEAPTVPTEVGAGLITNTQINLSWNESTDNTAVAYYKVFRSGIEIGTTTSNSYLDTQLNPGTTYIYTVVAGDNYDNESAVSASVSATTTNSTSDTEAPSTPENLVATATSCSGISLVWEASTDNDAVATYSIYREGELVAQVRDTLWEDTLLDPLTTYEYEVLATDLAGNKSNKSAPASATTDKAPVVSSLHENKGLFDKVLCYPNPTKGSFTLEFSLAKSDEVEQVVLNILGEVVNRIKLGYLLEGEKTVKVDISSQPEGIYLYQLITSEKVYTGRIRLEK